MSVKRGSSDNVVGLHGPPGRAQVGEVQKLHTARWPVKPAFPRVRSARHFVVCGVVAPSVLAGTFSVCDTESLAIRRKRGAGQDRTRPTVAHRLLWSRPLAGSSIVCSSM